MYEGLRRPLGRSAAPSSNFTLAALNAPHRKAAAAGFEGVGPAAAAAGAAPPPGVAAAPIGANAPPPPMGAATGTSSATAPPGAGASASATSATARTSPTFKLRLNTILNQMTARGTFVGNNAGVLALIYNIFNCTIDKYRGKHDVYGSMASGGMTGLVWKSTGAFYRDQADATAGLRPALMASGLLTAGAAGWTQFKQQFLR